jgi:plastocyanin
MKDDLPQSGMVGEVRFKVPLVIAIPFGALLLIALLAIGLSRVLLSVPTEAATAIAIVMAANVLGACAFIATRRRVGGASLLELLLVVLYPVIVGVAIAQFGLAGEETEAAPTEAVAEAEPATGQGPAATTTELVASGTSWDTDQISFEANKPGELAITNDDPVTHNLSIYPDEEAALAKQDPLFQGEDVEPQATADYKVDPLKRGTYTFICDYHSNMIGEVTVE